MKTSKVFETFEVWIAEFDISAGWVEWAKKDDMSLKVLGFASKLGGQ
jgi:hypothetical protein